MDPWGNPQTISLSREVIDLDYLQSIGQVTFYPIKYYNCEAINSLPFSIP